MRPFLLPLLALCFAFAGAGALAQAAGPAAARPPELPQACAALQPSAQDAASLGLRAQCVLAGLLPSTRRWAEARDLARESMRQGDGDGALVLFLAFATDPGNSYVRDGKPDLARYRELGARPAAERKDQAEAIDALAFAASRGNTQAMLLLANYFHDTSAPHNVERVRETTGLLLRNGLRSELNDRMLREAQAILRTAAQTKASARSFLDTYRTAEAAAVAGPAPAARATKCASATLRSVSSGDLQDAQYLALQHPMVANTFLLKGEWTEFWSFDACGEEVPLKITFVADGWGGATSTIAHNR